MHSASDMNKTELYEDAPVMKGVDGMLDVMNRIRKEIKGAHADVKVLLVLGTVDNQTRYYGNNLTDGETLELAIRMQNGVHDQHYNFRQVDLEVGVTADDLADSEQIIT